MTDQPKWTPGPWEVAATADDLVVKGRAKIASTYPSDGDVWGNANAHLIAAAPDMAEALEKALNFITNTESEMGETLPCGDAARAALAKARGETK